MIKEPIRHPVYMEVVEEATNWVDLWQAICLLRSVKSYRYYQYTLAL